MSKIRLYGTTSGFVELAAPDVAADNTVNIGDIPQFSGTPADGDLMRYDGTAGEWALVHTLEAEVIGSGTLGRDRLPAGFLYLGQRRYTTPGASTFVKADAFGDGSNVLPRAIRIRMVGGGGGSGGCPATDATQFAFSGAGGGATYAESFVTDIAGLSSSVAVTVGAGGAGGAAGTNNASTGGSSSFGSLVVAPGGGGGSAAAARAPSFPNDARGADAGNHGTSGTGDITILGEAGTVAVYAGIFGAFQYVSRAGGSFLSGAARGNVVGTAQAGVTSSGFGVGAFGAANLIQQASSLAGAAGSNGIVIIDVFV
jgi:hypothetical protein